MNGSVKKTDNLDTTAGHLRLKVGEYTSAQWIAAKVERHCGSRASVATCRIQALADETSRIAPDLVGSSAVLDMFKHGARCVIDGISGESGESSAGSIVMIGGITDVGGSLADGEDVLIVEVSDDRYLLEAYQIIGSWWYSAGDASYRMSVPAHFNPRGQPNGRWVTSGSGGPVKVFCAPNYGIADGEMPADPGDTAAEKASYFRTEDKLNYYYWLFNNAVIPSIYKWFKPIPSSVVWKSNYYNAISAQQLAIAQAGGNTYTSMRKGKEQNIEGMTLLAALSQTVAEAGHFDIDLIPTGEQDKAELKIVQTHYDGGGVNVIRPNYNKAQDVMKDWNIITQGNYKESSRSTYTLCAGAGQAVYIERRCSTDAAIPPQTSPSTNIGTLGLVFAWDSTLIAAAQVEAGGLMDTQYLSKDEAARRIFAQPKYSKLFAAYRLANSFDFQAGTREQGHPRAAAARPVLPYLLTSFLELNAFDRLQAHAEIRPEYAIGATWALPDDCDGLTQVDCDGTLWFRNLRNLGYTYTCSAVKGVGGKYVFTFTPRRIRATLAIPCDRRLDYCAKISTDPTVGVPVVDGNTGDEERFDTGLSRVYFADARHLYQQWLRKDSYPTPESVGGTKAEDKCVISDELRSDEKYLQDHINRRVWDICRLNRSARLIIPRLSFTYTIGTSIKDLTGTGTTFPIHAQIVGINYYGGDNDGPIMTELVLQ